MAANRAYRILPLACAPVSAQLAATEALWQDVAARRAPATLRWYTYPSPALVLGIGQHAPGFLRQPAATTRPPIAQRPSGGAAVYAAPELLALDLALPADHPLACGDVVEAYRWVGQAFATALGRLVPARRDQIVLVTIDQARADRRAQQGAAPGSAAALRGLACFGVLSPYEVALACQAHSAGEGWAKDERRRTEDERRRTGDEGQGTKEEAAAGVLPSSFVRRPSIPGTDSFHLLRKLVGLAQLRKRGVVLFQAGLYTRFPSTPLARLLAPTGGDTPALAAELELRAADLAALGLERHVPAVIEAVSHQLAQRLEGSFGYAPAEKSFADALDPLDALDEASTKEHDPRA
jgi:lipoate-protein ligase A